MKPIVGVLQGHALVECQRQECPRTKFRLMQHAETKNEFLFEKQACMLLKMSMLLRIKEATIATYRHSAFVVHYRYLDGPASRPSKDMLEKTKGILNKEQSLANLGSRESSLD